MRAAALTVTGVIRRSTDAAVVPHGSMTAKRALGSVYWRPMLTFRHVLVGLACSAIALAQPKEPSMTHHARGTFTVKMQPLTSVPAAAISRFSIDKEIHGDLEATSKGEMFSAGDPKSGAAGYVAMESVTGALAGKHGTFALQHEATMDASGLKLSVIVVPGSGTGELKGISGSFEIKIENGQHLYDFDYRLPE
jgi:hypothetical protein